MGRISKPMNKRRKITVTKVEEVNFDPDARHEYLTGFHKRKVQRAKVAQEIAVQKAREEKRQDRKVMREERAAEFKRAIEEHKRQLQRLKAEDGGSSDEEEEGEDSDGEWQGIEEPPPVDYEAEYIDEDKYTTVTVEEMDPSREGLRKSIQEEDSDLEDAEKAEAAKTTADTEEKSAKKRKKTTSSIKKKKKQFRYESKSDRKLNQVKQRINKNKKASARKEG
ncbi:hypothetical protein N7495_002831 [Penicillium taxi]|uniref:uncharacterized protein n=1 Tax=Penicillium taxi TaxID=168475 RepID=UPI002545A723|nr:uncharacterized protein N7495_002831 [Penicillium taxi]KAJ5902303.1 hypothetical protein N7495_002831 [Penicillium taxi]